MSKSTTLQKRNMSFVRVCLLLLLSALSLMACSGSGSDNSPDVSDDQVASGENDPNELGTIENVPVGEGELVSGDSQLGDPESEAERVGLVVASSQRCAVVSEPVEVVITSQLEEDDEASESGVRPNITGLVTFDQSLGNSLELVSRNDDAAIFQMTEQDIVGLTASTANSSVTAFIAGYDNDAPESFIIRKPVSSGCLYAFKSQNECVTGLSTTGNFAVSRNGVSISAVGCELQNPDNLPLIELPAGGL